MAQKTFFPIDSVVALRQPKTDRLILARFLKDAAKDKRLDEKELRAAHAGEKVSGTVIDDRWAISAKASRQVRTSAGVRRNCEVPLSVAVTSLGPESMSPDHRQRR